MRACCKNRRAPRGSFVDLLSVLMPLSNQKKTVTGCHWYDSFRTPHVDHLHWSAEFVRRNPLAIFCGAAGYSVRWIFSPQKNRTSYPPWNFLYWGVHFSPWIPRGIHELSWLWYASFCLPHGQPQNLRWRPGGGFHMRGSDCRRCDRA